MEKGKIVQILGPVIDVEFETEQLPLIHDALTVVNKGKKLLWKWNSIWEIVLYAVSY